MISGDRMIEIGSKEPFFMKKGKEHGCRTWAQPYTAQAQIIRQGNILGP